MIKLVNDRINHHLRLGYNIGKAFVVGEEDILLHFNRVTSGVIASITNMMKDRIDISRLNVIRSLGSTYIICMMLVLFYIWVINVEV